MQLLTARLLVIILAVCLGWVGYISPVQAKTIDPYIRRFLQVSQPVSIKMDQTGQTQLFSPNDLHQGKVLFQDSCMNCHVGGSTVPNPMIPLSLTALQGATPARDDVNSLVAYMRKPMVYDGSEETYSCRQVSESWLSQAELEKLAAFILRAAEKAPGWGTDQF